MLKKLLFLTNASIPHKNISLNITKIKEKSQKKLKKKREIKGWLNTHIWWWFSLFVCVEGRFRTGQIYSESHMCIEIDASPLCHSNKCFVYDRLLGRTPCIDFTQASPYPFISHDHMSWFLFNNNKFFLKI